MANYILDKFRAARPDWADASDEELALAVYTAQGTPEPFDKFVVDKLGMTPSGPWASQFKAGWQNYKAGMESIPAALGSDTAQQWADENNAKSQFNTQIAQAGGIPQSYHDVDSISSGARYVGGLAAQSAPYMGEALLGGAVARGLSGGLRGALALARASGDVTAEQAILRQLATRANVGVVAGTYPSSLGDVLQNQYEQSGKYDAGNAAALAVPYAALNILGVEGGAARLAGRGALGELPFKSRIVRGLAGMGEGLVGEAINEGGQQVANEYGRAAVDPTFDPWGQAAQERIKESIVGGGAMGAVFGGGSGALSKYRGLDDKNKPTDVLNPQPGVPTQQAPTDLFYGAAPVQGELFPQQPGGALEQPAVVSAPAINPQQGDLFAGAPQQQELFNGPVEPAVPVAPPVQAVQPSAPAVEAPTLQIPKNAAKWQSALASFMDTAPPPVQQATVRDLAAYFIDGAVEKTNSIASTLGIKPADLRRVNVNDEPTANRVITFLAQAEAVANARARQTMQGMVQRGLQQRQPMGVVDQTQPTSTATEEQIRARNAEQDLTERIAETDRRVADTRKQQIIAARQSLLYNVIENPEVKNVAEAFRKQLSRKPLLGPADLSTEEAGIVQKFEDAKAALLPAPATQLQPQSQPATIQQKKPVAPKLEPELRLTQQTPTDLARLNKAIARREARAARAQPQTVEPNKKQGKLFTEKGRPTKAASQPVVKEKPSESKAGKSAEAPEGKVSAGEGRAVRKEQPAAPAAKKQAKVAPEIALTEATIDDFLGGIYGPKAKPASPEDIQESRTTTTPAKPHTAESLTAKIKSQFVGPRYFSNVATVVNTAADLPVQYREKINPDTQAFVADGKAWFIADRINKGTEQAVALHEIGSHLGLEKAPQFESWVAQIKDWANHPDNSLESKVATWAQARLVKANVAPQQYNNELLAYFIEEAVRSNIKPRSRLGQIVNEIVQWVKRQLQRVGYKNPGALTGRDLVTYAYGAANLALSGQAQNWKGKKSYTPVGISPKQFAVNVNTSRMDPRVAEYVMNLPDEEPVQWEGFGKPTEVPASVQTEMLKNLGWSGDNVTLAFMESYYPDRIKKLFYDAAIADNYPHTEAEAQATEMTNRMRQRAFGATLIEVLGDMLARSIRYFKAYDDTSVPPITIPKDAFLAAELDHSPLSLNMFWTLNNNALDDLFEKLKDPERAAERLGYDLTQERQIAYSTLKQRVRNWRGANLPSLNVNDADSKAMHFGAALFWDMARKYSVTAKGTAEINSKNKLMPINQWTDSLIPKFIELLKGGVKPRQAFASAYKTEVLDARIDILEPLKAQGYTGWMKFEGEENAKALHIAVSDQAASAKEYGYVNSEWCLARGETFATSYLNNGPFYIYFKDGKTIASARVNITGNYDPKDMMVEWSGWGTSQAVTPEVNAWLWPELIKKMEAEGWPIKPDIIEDNARGNPALEAPQWNNVAAVDTGYAAFEKFLVDPSNTQAARELYGLRINYELPNKQNTSTLAHKIVMVSDTLENAKLKEYFDKANASLSPQPSASSVDIAWDIAHDMDRFAGKFDTLTGAITNAEWDYENAKSSVDGAKRFLAGWLSRAAEFETERSYYNKEVIYFKRELKDKQKYADQKKQQLDAAIASLNAKAQPIFESWAKVVGATPEEVAAASTQPAPVDAEFQQSVRAEAVDRMADTVTNNMERARRWSLPVMMLSHIVDVYGKKLPTLKNFYEAVSKMSQKSNTILEKFSPLYQQWVGMPAADRQAFANLAIEASAAQAYPDLVITDVANNHLTTPEQKAKHAELRAKYQELIKRNPVVKDLYTRMYSQFNENWNQREDLLRRNARGAYQRRIDKALARSDPTEAARLKKDLAGFEQDLTDLLTQLKGPYFPFLRFGDWVVVAKSAEYQRLEQEAEALSARIKSLTQPDTRLETLDKQINDMVAALEVARKRGKKKEALLEMRSELIKMRREARSIKRDQAILTGAKEMRSRHAELNKQMATMQANAKHHVVSFHKTKSEATREAALLRTRGLDVMPGYPRTKTDRAYEYVGMSKQLYDKLSDVLDVTVGETEASRANAAVLQMYIDSLSEMSAVRRQLRRMNTPGIKESEALQMFVTAAIRDAHYLSSLEHNNDIVDALTKVSEQAQKEGGEYPTVANHIVERYDRMMTPDRSPIQDMVTQFNFLWLLGVSPAYTLTNSTQGHMVSVPLMSGKYGFMRSFREYNKAGADAFRILKEIVGKGGKFATIDFGDVKALDGRDDVRRALETILLRGRIDITIAQEMYSTAFGRNMKLTRLTKAMSLPAFYSEALNRIATAISAYNLARSEGMSHDVATEYADDMVIRSQIDYSKANAPAFMLPGGALGGMRKIIGQFRKYQIGMAYQISKLTYDSVKGDISENPEARKEARRALGAMLSMQFAMAGALGLPIAGPAFVIAKILGSIFGDDDEPNDPETMVRNFLVDLTGDAKLAQAIAKGIPSALGPDVSARIGYGDVFMPVRNIQSNKDWAKWYQDLIVGALGPTFGMGARAFDAVDLIKHGDYVKAAERLMPKAFGDVVKASRIANEGVTTRSDNPVISSDKVTGMDVLWQAIGFNPTDIADKTEARVAKETATTAVSGARKNILDAWVKARRNGDTEAMADAMRKAEAFNARHPDKGQRITGKTFLESWKARQQYQKELNDAGVRFRRSEREFRPITRFAE